MLILNNRRIQLHNNHATSAITLLGTDQILLEVITFDEDQFN